MAGPGAAENLQQGHGQADWRYERGSGILKITLVCGNGVASEEVEFEYQSKAETAGKRPMVLDALLQAETEAMPELAYRYGCRNGLCGVCTVDVNGTSRLACRTKLREGDRIGAVLGLPVLHDLVVRRDGINRQLLGRIPVTGSDTQEAKGAENDENANF
jgi:succinate dehydrogenase/fumarate reductase-like Fe-S protein